MKKLITIFAIGCFILFIIILLLPEPPEPKEEKLPKEIEIIETVKPAKQTIAEKIKIEEGITLKEAIEKMEKVENPQPDKTKKIESNRWEHSFKFSDGSQLIIRVMDSDQLIYKIEIK